MMPQYRVRKPAVIVTLVLIVGALLAVWFCRHYLIVNTKSHAKFVCNSTASSESGIKGGFNTLVIYTGRWKFLRILFPYIYRELRGHGGVIDRVWFMMVNYDDETLTNLSHLTQVANQLFGHKVFEMHFMGSKPGKLLPKKSRYPAAYYEMFHEIIQNNSNMFFKIDDDIVYIHRGTIKNMLESKNSHCCFLHFANTVQNWRCNIKHEELGVYSSDDVNPKKLKFDFDPNGKCGWKSPECAEMTLRTFLHHYHQGQLDKYHFTGTELLNERKRFSIHLFMLDKDVIDIEAMLEVGPIYDDDEGWWTMPYSSKFERPNCIVGGGLVVHFSYYSTYDKMLQLGLLQEFESIVQKEVGMVMEKELWKVLNFPG